VGSSEKGRGKKPAYGINLEEKPFRSSEGRWKNYATSQGFFLTLSKKGSKILDLGYHYGGGLMVSIRGLLHPMAQGWGGLPRECRGTSVVGIQRKRASGNSKRKKLDSSRKVRHLSDGHWRGGIR